VRLRERHVAEASGRGFGASLTVAEVEALESASGVRLPDGYRRLLPEIGDGGKGPPACGLMKLGEVPSDFSGAERGQVWQLTGEGATPCAPRRGFLSWLEHWLDGGEDWWSDFQPGDEAGGR
jgi:hypothetical protein